MSDFKCCTKCLQDKPVARFSKRNDTADGLGSHCRDCMTASRRALRARQRGEDAPVGGAPARDDRYRYIVDEYVRVLPLGAPKALCAGKADQFELKGLDATDVRWAVKMCGGCPFAMQCAEDAEGTVGMIRAGLVYTDNGTAHDPERYIARHLGGGLRNLMREQVKDHAAVQVKLPTGERDPLCPIGKGNITGYDIGCRCNPCSVAAQYKVARAKEREMGWAQ